MGKKNRKSRHHDDDLLLADQSEANPPDGSVNGSSTKQHNPVNIDLMILEQQMAYLVTNYPDRSDDWIYRTAEKNMKLPKHSLENSLEQHILENILEQSRMNADEDDEECEAEGGQGEECDENVSALNEDYQDESNTLEEEDLQSLPSDVTFPVSVLLALQPYTVGPSSDRVLFTRFFLVLRQCVFIFIFQVLGLIFGQSAKKSAGLIWQKVHLPLIEAELRAKEEDDELRKNQLEADLLAKEKEEDLRTLRENAHLWSVEEKRWIEKDAVFRPPRDGSEAQTFPSTIRWNPLRKQWERWNKNLTTRTKKQAQESSSLTKGTFLAVKEGEGWASSPNEAEVENKQLTTKYIKFFACLPNNHDEGTLDVVDVTSWASKTVLPTEAARALGAVDSGKALFSFDLSAVKKKSDGKQKKKSMRAEAKHVSPEDDWIAIKGIGATAQLSKRYLDKMK